MKPVRFLGEGCPALVERDAQLSLSLLSLAGLDEDHTIRTLNTVKRGRGSVLEDGDALDLIHVYGADVAPQVLGRVILALIAGVGVVSPENVT